MALDRWGGAAAWGACAVLGSVAGAGYWALLRRPAAGPSLRAAGAVGAPDEVRA